MPSDLIKTILTSLNKEVINSLDLAKSITHPGESGRAREQIIADFFRRFLPSNFGISTGFVIDAAGGISRQIDLVIYRSDYHPVFEIGGIKHFLAESVVAVMENKASTASTEKLSQALENIKSVKQLDRTGGGENYKVVGSWQAGKVSPNSFDDQVFGVILTEESLKRDTLRQELLKFLQSTPRSYWPNFYADVRHLAAFYLRSTEPAEITVRPEEASFLAVTDDTSDNFVPPLIELASELLDFLRVAPLVDYRKTAYLLSGGGRMNWWKI